MDGRGWTSVLKLPVTGPGADLLGRNERHQAEKLNCATELLLMTTAWGQGAPPEAPLPWSLRQLVHRSCSRARICIQSLSHAHSAEC